MYPIVILYITIMSFVKIVLVISFIIVQIYKKIPSKESIKMKTKSTKVVLHLAFYPMIFVLVLMAINTSSNTNREQNFQESVVRTPKPEITEEAAYIDISDQLR